MHILEVETEFSLFRATYIPSCDAKSYKYIYHTAKTWFKKTAALNGMDHQTIHFNIVTVLRRIMPQQ